MRRISAATIAAPLLAEGRIDGALDSRRGHSLAERAHLDHVVPGDRMRGRSSIACSTIGAADDVDAADELLGLDERAVAEQRLAVADADRRGRVRALQRVPQDLEAACLQVLRQASPSRMTA